MTSMALLIMSILACVKLGDKIQSCFSGISNVVLIAMQHKNSVFLIIIFFCIISDYNEPISTDYR